MIDTGAGQSADLRRNINNNGIDLKSNFSRFNLQLVFNCENLNLGIVVRQSFAFVGVESPSFAAKDKRTITAV